MTEQTTEQAAPVEAAVPENATPSATWSPDVEQEARALGWKAEDEWKGEKPAGYIPDPVRYLERAESFAPFRKLKEQNAEALRRIEAVAAKQVERDRAAHAAELARVKAEKAAAVETGDVEAYKALDKQEDRLREAAPEAPQKSAVPDNHRAAIENWSVDKPWFKKDQSMTIAAANFYGEAQADGLTDPQAILKFVDRRMGETFTQLTPKAARDSTVESGLTLGGGAKPGAFETLPRDAKDAFQRFVQRGVIEDTKEARAQWAEDYNAA